MGRWPRRTTTATLTPSILGWGSVSIPGPREYQPHRSLHAASPDAGLLLPGQAQGQGRDAARARSAAPGGSVAVRPPLPRFPSSPGCRGRPGLRPGCLPRGGPGPHDRSRPLMKRAAPGPMYVFAIMAFLGLAVLAVPGIASRYISMAAEARTFVLVALGVGQPGLLT